jgi:hypothetical protein
MCVCVACVCTLKADCKVPCRHSKCTASKLQHTATHAATRSAKHTATHIANVQRANCNTLQHTLQHTMQLTLQHTQPKYSEPSLCTLRADCEVPCRHSKCTASKLQHTATCSATHIANIQRANCNTLQHTLQLTLQHT